MVRGEIFQNPQTGKMALLEIDGLESSLGRGLVVGGASRRRCQGATRRQRSSMVKGGSYSEVRDKT